MSNPAPGGGDIFDVKKVRRLVELMKEHDLAEVDLRQGDQRVRLRRGAEGLITAYAPPAMIPAPAPLAAAASSGAAKPATGDSDLAVVKSPMVGTFYSASSPESPPFIKVGDHVGKETTV